MEEFYETNEIGLDLHLEAESFQILGLNLSPDSESESEEKEWGSDSWRTSRLLKAAVTAAKGLVPSLTETQWVLMLEAQMPTCFVKADLAETSILHLVDRIYHEHGEIGSDLSTIADLDDSAIMPITLVVNRFWQRKSTAMSLREVLSEISGRPQESVFSDDPEIEDLWSVQKVEVCKNDISVELDFLGGETATCRVERISKEEVKLNDVQLSSERPLVPPNECPHKYLFGLALPSICEKLHELGSEFIDAS